MPQWLDKKSEYISEEIWVHRKKNRNVSTNIENFYIAISIKCQAKEIWNLSQDI